MSTTTATITTSSRAPPKLAAAATATTQSTPSTTPLALPVRRKTMSLTQTYFLAHKARAKLSHEAAQPDHNLRLLVGHANLLDSLMLDLADAEREQESWFNHSVRGATSKSEDKHIQWADSVIEDPEEDWRVEDADSDSDSDSDFDDEEDVEMASVVSLRRVPSSRPAPQLHHTDSSSYEDMEEDDDEEDYAHLALSRTPSHSSSPPPELEHDLDSSDDESMPPSPPTAVLPTFATEKSSYHDSKQEHEDKVAFFDDGYYLPQRNPARLISAISVY